MVRVITVLFVHNKYTNMTNISVNKSNNTKDYMKPRSKVSNISCIKTNYTLSSARWLTNCSAVPFILWVVPSVRENTENTSAWKACLSLYISTAARQLGMLLAKNTSAASFSQSSLSPFMCVMLQDGEAVRWKNGYCRDPATLQLCLTCQQAPLFTAYLFTHNHDPTPTYRIQEEEMMDVLWKGFGEIKQQNPVFEIWK